MPDEQLLQGMDNFSIKWGDTLRNPHPRYVDTFEEEEEIDLDQVKDEISPLEGELATVRAKMQAHLKELGV